MRQIHSFELLSASILALAVHSEVAAQALVTAPTSAQLDQQIAALEEMRRQTRFAEEQAALAAQAAAAENAARARAAEAHARYVASGGQPLFSPPPASPPPAPSPGTTQTPQGNQASVASAAPPPPPPPPASGNSQKFGGIEFGVGVAFSYDLGRNDRIREATLVNGIVRVARSDNVRARLILETHYFFTPESQTLPLFGLRNTPNERTWGWGPFVAIQPGSDTVIDAIGGGLMVGLRRTREGNDSFNLGIGILYDIDARILGEGIVANEPLPEGETAIRYQHREQSGLLILSSYTF